MLRLDAIDVQYGSVRALRGVSLEVGDGGAVAVLGANGAGKSTLLRAISGIIPTMTGTITFDGTTLSGRAAEEIVTRGIAHVPEGRRLFQGLSVADNLQLGAYTRTGRGAALETRHSLDEVYGLFPRLSERRSQMAGSLSGGEQQMVAIGRAIMSKPQLLMLDEPSLGLAPLVIESIYQALRQLKSSGRSLLIVEQNIGFAGQIADRAVLLQNGAIMDHGTFSELRDRGSLRSAYLGKRVAPQ